MNQQSMPFGLYLGLGQNTLQTEGSASPQGNVGARLPGEPWEASNSEEISSEPWPPRYPDKSWEDILPLLGKEIGSGALGSVAEWQGWAVKTNSYQHEYDMVVKAGDCAVKTLGRAMTKIQGRPVMKALLMELKTPLDIKKITAAEKPAMKREMIRLVCMLHEEYKMVHGDIKPSNFLRCQDGSLRLCDFDSARLMDDDVNEWEGLATSEFLAPNRNYFETGQTPTPVDDIYALGLSIWSLYTGKEVLKDTDIEQILRDRLTVDLDEIEDIETRWFVRLCLRSGGAQV